MRRNDSSKILLSTFLGILISLAALEILLHFYNPYDLKALIRTILGEKLRDCQKTDRLLNHVLIPNCEGIIKTQDYKVNLKTNSYGLREKEFSKEKGDDVFRVLLIGDSFVEGWGVEVEDRFDKVAKRQLEELEENSKETTDPKKSKKIEIINAGVRSYAPILELIYLKKYGIELKPDLVIMSYDFSDLHDDFYYGGWPLHNEIKSQLGLEAMIYLEEWPKEELKHRNNILIDKSKLVNFLYTIYKHQSDNSNKKITLTNLINDISLFAKAENWEDFDKAWNLSLSNIFLMRDFLEENNIEFALMVIPRGIYIGENEWHKGRAALGIKSNIIYDSHPIEYLETKISQEGIDIITLTNHLKDSRDQLLYYPMDGHWTKKANEIVGKSLAKYLEDYLANKPGEQ